MTTFRLDVQCERYRDAAFENLDAIRAALAEQQRHLAAAWGEYVDRVSELVVASGWHVVFLDDSDQAGALGYHDVTPDGTPYARVFVGPTVENGGSWTDGANSVSVTASHEVCEVVGDPGANRWANAADGTLYALELADAVEADAYTASNGVSVSNFLWPAYFDPFARRGAQPFDQMGLVTAPFEVTPGGYAIRLRGGKIDQVWGDAYPEAKRETKTAGSRTQARRNWLAAAGASEMAPEAHPLPADVRDGYRFARGDAAR